MNTQVEQYINSGLLEAYVTGSASLADQHEVLRLKEAYPEVREALYRLEVDMEMLAASMAITPPPGIWQKIEADIDGIIAREKTAPEPFTEREYYYTPPQTDNAPQYISVESESSHMRIHKNWKWVFAAVFLLGKIFLATAIYFYLENRQAQEQIKELKSEIQRLR